MFEMNIKKNIINMHLPALLLIWTWCISIALKARWFIEHVYLKHHLNSRISVKTPCKLDDCEELSDIVKDFIHHGHCHGRLFTKETRHVNTSFEMTWIKCDSLIQGHHRLFQASCRVKTDTVMAHIWRRSLLTEKQTTQKPGKVHVNEPPAVSHHNSTIMRQEKTFVVRMKP